jgi:hypothetical protein
VYQSSHAIGAAAVGRARRMIFRQLGKNGSNCRLLPVIAGPL